MIVRHMLIALAVSVVALETARADEFDHLPWDMLLKQHVKVIAGSHSTAVNYQGMANDRTALKRYLQSLSAVPQTQFDQWNHHEQLAFLINAYNAWTVELILTAWPDLESIKDLGGLFSSPWSKAFIPLLGETRSLDNIEHQLIRGSGHYNDPRIHFAVNCASIGCPALRQQAYTGKQLHAQLQEQTHLFLSDRSRNRFEDGRLKLSSIFKWYREDFEKGWLDFLSLEEFLVAHADALNLSPSVKQQLAAEDINITFLDYDWRLNSYTP